MEPLSAIGAQNTARQDNTEAGCTSADLAQAGSQIALGCCDHLAKLVRVAQLIGG